MRCYICDESDNLDGAEIRFDYKIGKPICLVCFMQSFEALKEFGYEKDEQLGRVEVLEVGKVEGNPANTGARKDASSG